MRFKTSNLAQVAQHSELVSCVAWASADQVISIADDHRILSWNLVSSDTSRLAELAADFHPTDLHWFPRAAASASGAGQVSGQTDLFLVTSAEGKLQLMQAKSGRIDKSVEAHRGACLTARWSHDGAGIATGGEDGMVKIWSRSGMLRSTLVQSASPVYALAWSPDMQAVLYASGPLLTIKSLTPNSKPIQWKGHDEVILCVDWSASNGRIVSGSEDCRYKVWDSLGRQLYTSNQHEYPITSVSWSADGQLFAVGSFNTLRLCDKIGWSHSLDKPNTGSIFKISWSWDSTQVACACGNGHVLFAHVIEKRFECREHQAIVSSRKSINLRNVINDTWEKLDFRDRIIHASLGFDQLVVTTSSQCYIYSTNNWNTPHIFDLKEKSASLILQASKHFLLVQPVSLNLYTYEGRIVCSLKWPAMRPEALTAQLVSVSPDTIAVRDQKDEKLVHLFDAASGKPLHDGKPLRHPLQTDVVDVALDQVGPMSSRQLALVDKNNDLFLAQVRQVTKPGARSSQPVKLGTMVQSVKWNTDCNLLCVIQDTKLIIFAYPAVVFIDKSLLPLIKIEKDSSELGKYPSLVSFTGSHVSIRRGDGSLLYHHVTPYPAVLQDLMAANRWSDSVRLCRFVNQDCLWAMLAATALQAKNLDACEMAYSALKVADKVQYIQYIRQQPTTQVRNAETLAMMGQYQDAETLLLQSGLNFRAILLNIVLHQWQKALDLAIKHRTHVDTVLAFRTKYLSRCDKEETIDKFIEYNKEVNIDWQSISAKIQAEFDKERTKSATI